MRTARAFPVAFALALAPGWAWAEPPRVSVRLDYTRGQGGEACPAEPAALRGHVAQLMGYDPFDRPDAPERLVVVVVGQDRGFAARVQRFNAAGETTWAETFPKRPLHGDCAALFPPLASYLDGLFLRFQGPPAALPAASSPEPAPPSPAEPRPEPAPPAPLARAGDPPEPPTAPNPARTTARNVAIASYAAAGVFLGLGIAWSVDAQNKGDTAQSLSAQLHKGGGVTACTPTGDGTAKGCAQLVSAFQAADTAGATRNGWYAGAGVSAAVGVASTVLAFMLPSTIRGKPAPQLSLKPGGILIHGSF
jgi:hypothetical protein